MTEAINATLTMAMNHIETISNLVNTISERLWAIPEATVKEIGFGHIVRQLERAEELVRCGRHEDAISILQSTERYAMGVSDLYSAISEGKVQFTTPDLFPQ